MSPWSTWMSRCSVGVGLFATAMAQICTPEIGYEGNSYIVNNQSDVDAIAAKCTTINGGISVTTNYTGGFHLPNVRNITSNIRWFQYELTNDVPKMTSMDLPDLEYLGSSLEMPGMPTLKSFTAPKLATVAWGVNVEHAQEVDLRSLVDLEYLSITGDVSSLHLDSLRQVREDILICNMEDCDPKNTVNGSLDLSFPALHDVGQMDLQGRFSSFDTPSLTNITGLGGLYYSIKLVTAGGPTVNLSFPELKYINGGGLSFEGNIGSISIPDIRNMSVWFTVNAYDQLDIDLPFQEAQTISLSGNITGVQFPNLTSVDTFIVDSDASIDCKSVQQTIMTATNASEHAVHCQTSIGARFGVNLGAKAAFGFVVAAAVGLAIS